MPMAQMTRMSNYSTQWKKEKKIKEENNQALKNKTIRFNWAMSCMLIDKCTEFFPHCDIPVRKLTI